MMNVVLWVSLGVLIGWLARWAAPADFRPGTLLSIATGAVGALVGGGLVSPLVGLGATNEVAAFMVSIGGAVVLVALMHVLRRGSLR
jgi:uncharacterized membrane protein YeaQ/YmgE (transglycosylase-associated protein family)